MVSLNLGAMAPACGPLGTDATTTVGMPDNYSRGESNKVCICIHSEQSKLQFDPYTLA